MDDRDGHKLVREPFHGYTGGGEQQFWRLFGPGEMGGRRCILAYAAIPSVCLPPLGNDELLDVLTRPMGHNSQRPIASRSTSGAATGEGGGRQ